MSVRGMWVGGCVALACGLGACSDKGAGESGVRKSDTPAWQGSTAASAYVANGWKAGDQGSWEQQIRARAQGQNEYARAPVTTAP